jgi:predicted dithiol-disulfide oxidoreductase (DUF899 family)
MHDVRFPGENQAYRMARNELLKAELDLRRKVEEVAALRRTLPLGGDVPQDYVFEEGGADPADMETVREVRMSELFDGKETLLLYSWMYGPAMKAACPLCTSMLDGLEGQVDHVRQRAAIAVVGQSPIRRLRELARERGWKRHRIVSAAKNAYQRHYHGENADGKQLPTMNIFVRRGGAIRHFWASESLFASPDDGLDSRHIDQFWPLWQLLDLTPEGRGGTWYPELAYARR